MYMARLGRVWTNSAVQAVRRCSPMKIPAEFLPYYEQALHEVNIKFSDLD